MHNDQLNILTCCRQKYCSVKLIINIECNKQVNVLLHALTRVSDPSAVLNAQTWDLYCSSCLSLCKAAKKMYFQKAYITTMWSRPSKVLDFIINILAMYKIVLYIEYIYSYIYTKCTQTASYPVTLEYEWRFVYILYKWHYFILIQTNTHTYTYTQYVFTFIALIFFFT